MNIFQANRGITPGLILYAISIAIPLFWIFSLDVNHKFSALFAQFLGIFALITMSYVQLLATRLPILEQLFGGLDRIYVIHKWLAIGALVALLLHENLDPAVVSGSRPTNGTILSAITGKIKKIASKSSYIILRNVAVTDGSHSLVIPASDMDG